MIIIRVSVGSHVEIYKNYIMIIIIIIIIVSLINNSEIYRVMDQITYYIGIIS